MMTAKTHVVMVVESAGSEWEGGNNSLNVEAGESCRNSPREREEMGGVVLTQAVVVAAGEEGSIVDGG